MAKLSNKPYKGTQDFVSTDMLKLRYIWNAWKDVCESYNYIEYLTPVLEPAEIYEAKSGEDIKKEMYILTDKGNRRLTMRPEMTPSVSRLVTKIFSAEPKPIKLYSIANFFRGERPQKGRTREFWQLNYDIFGEESVIADLEIIKIAIEIMLKLGAPKNSFVLKYNNRKLVNFFLEKIVKVIDAEKKTELLRKMDKFEKLTEDDFTAILTETGLNSDQISKVKTWLSMSIKDILKAFPEAQKTEGYKEIAEISETLKRLSLSQYSEFSTSLIRGFDYYDGTVFEVFDKDPEFNRSLFGGGRYNGLSDLFSSTKISAVGAAPGNESLSIFLDNWRLWPDFSQNKQVTYVPILESTLTAETLKFADQIRSQGDNVETSFKAMPITKALDYANKKSIPFVLIFGSKESAQGIYKIKDMETGIEKSYPLGYKEKTSI